MVDHEARGIDRVQELQDISSRRLDQHAALAGDHRRGTTTTRQQTHLAEKLACHQRNSHVRTIVVDLYFDAAGNTCNGAEDCRRAVRLQIARGADVIKFASTGGVNSRIGAGLGAQMFSDEARAIVETAKLFGKKVSAHAHGADGIRLALEAGVDSIEHGTILDPETIDAFVASDAYYVPTLSTVNGYIERLQANPDAYEPDVRAKIEWRIGITGKSLEILYAQGVRIAFGTDAGVSKHGRNADEFELMVKFGMPPVEAIKAATVNAADLLGLTAEIGTLEPGKSADLIAVKGDPLKDVKVLKQVDFVMVRGDVAKE